MSSSSISASVQQREISFSAPNISSSAPSHTQSERGRPPTYQFVMNVNAMSWSYMLKQAGVLNQQLPDLKRRYLVSPTKSAAYLELAPPNPSPVLRKHRLTIDSQNLAPKLSSYRWERTEQKYAGQPQATDRPYRHSHQFSDWMVKSAEPTVRDPVLPQRQNVVSKSHQKTLTIENTPPVVNQHLEKIYDKLHTSRDKDKSVLIKKLNRSLPVKRVRDIPTINPYFYNRLQQAVQPELVLPRGYSYMSNRSTEFDDPVYSSNGSRPLGSENVKYRPATNLKTGDKLERVYFKPTYNRHFRSNRQASKSVESFNKIVTSKNQTQPRTDNSESNSAPHKQNVMKGEFRALVPSPDLGSKSVTNITEKDLTSARLKIDEHSISIPQSGHKKPSEVCLESEPDDEDEEPCYTGLQSVTITPKPQSRPDTQLTEPRSRPNTTATNHAIEQE